MRDHILLYVNGRPVRVSGGDIFLSLSDFLRRRMGLTGTKVVCAEGDCGSCAALIGRPDGNGIRYAAVTSCIQIVFQLDGAHVVTIEGLRAANDLNPVQQAMVKCQGTQCGFCTPGFVVALCDVMQGRESVDAHTIRRGLVGNLCRCTGYDSIIRAGLSVDPRKLPPLDTLYPPEAIAPALARAGEQEVLIETGARKFYKPVEIERAARFRGDNPRCVVISGATDIGVVYNKRTRAIDVALSTAGIGGAFRAVALEGDALYVGAGATLAALEQAALVHLPELGRFLSLFGSPLIKNAGTLGGNLVTGSPIGDTIPALMALEAEIDLAGPSARRRVPIHAFYTGYRQTVLTPDELVAGVRIPLPRAGETFRLYKVSRRKDLDISSFGAAVWVRQSNGTVDDVRIWYGGVGPMVMRMRKAEAVLRGNAPTLERFEQAGAVAREEVTPITDVRGSEQYRRTLAGNILLKFWHDAVAGASPDDAEGNDRHPKAPADGRGAGVSPALAGQD